MKKRYKVLFGILAILATAYLLGPKPKKPIFDKKPLNVPDLDELEKFISKIESEHKIKPGNEAEIIWQIMIISKPNTQWFTYMVFLPQKLKATQLTST